MVEEESLNNAIKTVVREHHWEPSVIGGLFLDDQDYEGLLYWYDDVITCGDKIKQDINKL